MGPKALVQTMKVLILTNKMPYPARDGGSIATMNMLRAYEAISKQVSCLAMNTSKHPVEDGSIPEQLGERTRFETVRCNTRIRPLALLLNFLFSGQPYIAMRFQKRAFASKLKELLVREDFDLVQMEGPYLAHYLELIRKNSGARIALRAHNVEHRIWSRKASNTSFFLTRFYLSNMARRLERFEARLAAEVDHVISISPEDQAYYDSLGSGSRSFCIPTGIDMQQVRSSPLPEQPDLFYIGALDWIPNREGLSWFLDEVYPLIREQRPQIRFHVAGRNAPVSFLKRVEAEGIDYHGEVPDARAFMKDHYLMVVPLLSGSGMRIKILEGMALGRPIVSSPMGLQGIPASDPEHLRIASEAEGFAARIIELLSDPVTTAQMCLKARQLVETKFDTHELALKLQQKLTEK